MTSGEDGKRLLDVPRRSGAALQRAAQDTFAHFHDCTSCEEYSHAECRSCKTEAVAAERARIKAAVKGLDETIESCGETHGSVEKADVLAIVEAIDR